MNEVRVQVLGCGDAFGSGGRFNTCFYVEAPGTRFLIDCGASSLVAMKRFGVDPQQIDAILLTHFHGDHFGGIPFLERETQIAASRTRPLTIVGPRGVELLVHVALEVFFPGATAKPRTFPLEFFEYAADQAVKVGSLSVIAYPAIHTPGTEPHSLRVSVAGKVIAYTGDTEWNDALVDLARDVDLLICEAFTWEPKRNHLDYITLRERRAQLQCKRLLLTHLSDELLARRSEVEFEVAEDGLWVCL